MSLVVPTPAELAPELNVGGGTAEPLFFGSFAPHDSGSYAAIPLLVEPADEPAGH